MTDLSDVNMDNVKPMGEIQELPVGQYLVRVEDTEKKAAKEKFDAETSEKLPQGHYLQMSLKVYGGPNDGQTEFVRLNLWNSNPTAVTMAKSELKSIQEATGVVSSNSDHFHGKWMVLEIKTGVKDPKKLYKKYSEAPAAWLTAFAHIPPVPAKAPSMAASQPTPETARAAGAPPAVAAADALPSWAKK